jgi:hypothetical protein
MGKSSLPPSFKTLSFVHFVWQKHLQNQYFDPMDLCDDVKNIFAKKVDKNR